ncbi:MAG TPA: branched-chain amino acid ABC transporter permease [Chloroflexota bacterium]|jgi:branched-chain amino acid transport system permease protein|nr:branched-chain amino acid ABC transporter permease [Chloroflexota bacterium]
MLLLLFAAAALAYPIFDGSDTNLTNADFVEVYILLALGLNIVVGFAGLLDLGYAAFFAIGAYTIGLFASLHFSVGTKGNVVSNIMFTIGQGGIHINFFILIPLAAMVAAFFGILFGAPTLRLRGDYLAIVTLGFGEIVPKVVKNLGGGNGLFLGRNNTIGVPDITSGVNNIIGIDKPPDINLLWIHWTFQTNDPRPWYFLGLIIIIISIALIIRLRGSRIGRCWVAIREDEVAAAHAGVNVTGARLTAFALGAAFSGFGGMLYAAELGTVSYDLFGFVVSVTVLVMIILGGIGSIPGVILGAIIVEYLNLTWLTTISAWLNDRGGDLAHDWGPVGAFGRWLHTLPLNTAKPMIFGIILVGIMLLRPQGLLSERRRARELRPETELESQEAQEELWTLQTGEI